MGIYAYARVHMCARARILYKVVSLLQDNPCSGGNIRNGYQAIFVDVRIIEYKTLRFLAQYVGSDGRDVGNVDKSVVVGIALQSGNGGSRRIVGGNGKTAKRA